MHRFETITSKMQLLRLVFWRRWPVTKPLYTVYIRPTPKQKTFWIVSHKGVEEEALEAQRSVGI